MRKIVRTLALCSCAVCATFFGLFSVIFSLWAYARRFAEEIGDWADFREEYGQLLCSFGLSLATMFIVSAVISELVEKNKKAY